MNYSFVHSCYLREASATFSLQSLMAPAISMGLGVSISQPYAKRYGYPHYSVVNYSLVVLGEGWGVGGRIGHVSVLPL